MALIPTFAFTTDAEGVVINLLAGGSSKFALHDGTEVRMDLDSRYPADGRMRVVLHPPTRKSFAVKLRIPAWCASASVAVNGRPAQAAIRSGDYAVLQRDWSDGDSITLEIPLLPRLILGEHGNRGKAALAFGPLVLAADDALNPDCPIGTFILPSVSLGKLDFKSQPAPEGHRTWSGDETFSIRADLTTNTAGHVTGEPVRLNLAPFADAGCTLAPYQVWLPCHPPGPAPSP